MQAASLFESLKPIHQEKLYRLYHMHDGKSLADDPLFFAHPEGKTNIEKELSAFVEEYNNPKKKWGRFQVSLECAFPARVSFLQSIGLIKNRPKPNCEGWNKWQRAVAPTGLSLVFSTAYPNNPASMFGHTFLRFQSNTQKGTKKKTLLEYSANYSAMVSKNDTGIAYAMRGLFGGYHGLFDLTPYYTMVNDYVHAENRDLIEYDLNLSQGQVDFLFAHLWELYQASSFDYFFTWENCSFHLSELLDVVLEERLPQPKRWFYLPADLVHIVKERGLVASIHQRPSKKRELKAYMDTLKREELEKVKAAFSGEESLEHLSTNQLEVLIHYLNYEKFQEKGKVEKERKELYTKALVMRAKRGGAPVKLDYPPFKNQPHLAHQPQRISLGAFSRDQGEGLTLGYRSGYHELLSPDIGAESFSQFKFFSPTISVGEVNNKVKVALEEASFIEVVSLHPLSFFDIRPSWKAGGRYERFLNETICSTCGRLLAEGKVGVSLGNREGILSLLVGAVAEYSGRLDKNYRLSPAYEIIAGKTFQKLKILSTFEGRFDSKNMARDFDHRLSLGLSYYTQVNNTFRLLAKSLWRGDEFKQQGKSLSLEWGRSF